MFRLSRPIGLLAAVLAAPLVIGGGAAGACKLALNCHIRDYDATKESLKPVSEAPVIAPGFGIEDVASGFHYPTSFAFLPDGRIIVAEKGGILRLVAHGRVRDEPVLDLRASVNTFLIRGVVAVAVDSAFHLNRFLYVVYTPNPRGDRHGPTSARVSRFTVDAHVVAHDERVILGRAGDLGDSCTKLPPAADCIPSDTAQNGADIAFDIRGRLYISTGDGGGSEGVEPTAFRAQDINALGGKILHVTRTGDGLPSNPFFNGDVTANRSKVWALGLRNPFRLTLMPNSGLPVVGDVGWHRVEEIDVVAPRDNLGWPCVEGLRRTEQYRFTRLCRDLYARGQPLRPAVIRLRHPDARSVIGGVFYSGTGYPKRYRGAYIFGDWMPGWLRWARLDPATGKLEGGTYRLATNVAGPVQLREGPDGLIYYLSVNNGELRKIVWVAPASKRG